MAEDRSKLAIPAEMTIAADAPVELPVELPADIPQRIMTQAAPPSSFPSEEEVARSNEERRIQLEGRHRKRTPVAVEAAATEVKAPGTSVKPVEPAPAAQPAAQPSAVAQPITQTPQPPVRK